MRPANYQSIVGRYAAELLDLGGVDSFAISHRMDRDGQVAAENLRLRAALPGLVDAFKPFTVKPMGGPGSAVRLDQEAQIKAHVDAVALLRSVDVHAGK